MDRKRYYVDGAGTLCITGLTVEYTDIQGDVVHLAYRHQVLLALLAGAEGKLVTHEELYRAYTHQEPHGNYKQMVNNARGSICKPLRNCIVNVKDRGYRMDITKMRVICDEPLPPESSVNEPDVDENLKELAANLVGDYFGFYLDQNGDGSILGIRLHMEKQGDELMARAVLGIQSDEMFWDKAFPDILKGDRDHVVKRHKEFCNDYSANEQRCFYAEGRVTYGQSVAIIPMKSLAGYYWSIMLDMSKYQECAAYVRNTHTARGYPYRGGMGLMVALAASHGNFCCRCGLIRSEHMKESLKLNNKEAVEWLKISLKREWKPLSLDGDLDKEWYNWFMKLKA